MVDCMDVVCSLFGEQPNLESANLMLVTGVGQNK